jgi:hypothetical protein
LLTTSFSNGSAKRNNKPKAPHTSYILRLIAHSSLVLWKITLLPICRIYRLYLVKSLISFVHLTLSTDAWFNLCKRQVKWRANTLSFYSPAKFCA